MNARLAPPVCLCCMFALSVCGGDSDCIDNATVWQRFPDGSFCVRGDLIVTERSLDELAPLAFVTVIEGSLLIHDNPLLRETPAFPALMRIDGSLSISANSSLSHIGEFPLLDVVGHEIYVGENPGLEALTIPEGLSEVTAVFVALNPRLGTFESSLTVIDGDLTIVDNAMLASVVLPDLTDVAGSLRVAANPSLRTIDLSTLRRVSSRLQFDDNDVLGPRIELPALDEVAQVQVSGNSEIEEIVLDRCLISERLLIRENTRLRRLATGPTVRLADNAELYIFLNPALSTIEGFAAIDTLRYVDITDNDALVGVKGFTGLTSVATELRITRNSLLTGPSGWFPSLTSAGGVWIFGNPALSPAEVDALLAHVTVAGAIRVGDNQGQDTALDPCPWRDDRVCDAESDAELATELCLEDPEDCGD